MTASRARQDQAYRLVAGGAGAVVLILLGAILVFLLVRAEPALRLAGHRFLSERQWLPDGTPPAFGVAALAYGTLVSSAIALVLAVPVAVGSALFLTEVAPPRVGRLVGYLIDLLAAVPSVVYGLWGVTWLIPRLVPLEKHLDGALGFIPFLHSRNHLYGRSIFSAGVVLAIMVLPIVAAISREVFVRAPNAGREAALALGATRWEVIRYAVIPFGRGGVLGAVLLGLGRAMGETIAVALVLAASFTINPHVLEPGGNTIAANIATTFGEAGATGRSALVASGLVLFAITLVVNIAGRGVVRRSDRRMGA